MISRGSTSFSSSQSASKAASRFRDRSIPGSAARRTTVRSRLRSASGTAVDSHPYSAAGRCFAASRPASQG
eukprot:14507534-Alexandrium_andersonii.AAC.1